MDRTEAEKQADGRGWSETAGSVKIAEKLASCQKVLIGLGAEWQLKPGQLEKKQHLLRAYETLSEMIKDKDYFIVTMATDALIYETSLGSRTDAAVHAETDAEKVESAACASLDEKLMTALDRAFPKPEKPRETRWQRIVAPCGNETWRQCTAACTKDIWEPGELPEDTCPHCGAPLTGNTVEADTYIEEGYLPQWSRYTGWLTGTLNRELLILELGVGFEKPGIIRFPFEKTAFFNRKSFLYRVNEKFPQVTEELKGRAEGILKNSVSWVTQTAPKISAQ